MFKKRILKKIDNAHILILNSKIEAGERTPLFRNQSKYSEICFFSNVIIT